MCGGKKRKTTKIPVPEPPGLIPSWPDIRTSTEKGGIILTINEICSNNKLSKLDEHGENDDWIELFNPGAAAINVAGWYISDTLNTSVFHRIPSFDLAKTLIPAGGYLLLWADGQSAQGVTHLPFKLDKDGEAVYLSRLISGHYEMVDEIAFPKSKNDVTYGRIPNGTGEWKLLSDPTPMASNLPPRVLSGFILNELMVISGTGLLDDHAEQEDWVEFYNPTAYPINLGGVYLTDSVEYPIKSHVSVYSPDSTTIPPGGYLLFFADNETWQGVRHLSFKLPAKGGEVSVFQPDGSTLISSTSYPFQSADASFGRYPDGEENWINTIPTPGFSNQYSFSFVDGLFINELMADNQKSFPDNYGGYEDWIEIFNNNPVPVNMGGLYVTDSLSYPLKYRIPNTYPDSTTIPPQSFMILWADNHPELGVRHLDFKLDAGGESFGLVQLRGLQKEFLDSVTFPSQSTGVSYGRIEDAEPLWGMLKVPTPGVSNSVQSLVDVNSTAASVLVYPNPCVNRLNVKILLTSSNEVQIDIYSVGGKKISNCEFGDCHIGWNFLAMENLEYRLNPGFYFLKIHSGEQITYKTFQLLE